MRIETVLNGQEILVTLQGELSIIDASELRNALLETLSLDVESVRLDVSGVESVDISILQTICAFHCEMCQQQRKLVVDSGNNVQFLNAVRVTGFLRFSPCEKCKQPDCVWVFETEKARAILGD